MGASVTSLSFTLKQEQLSGVEQEMQCSQLQSAARVKDLLRSLDTSLDGTISCEAFGKIMMRLNKWEKKELEVLLKGGNMLNDVGRLKYVEFVDWIFGH